MGKWHLHLLTSPGGRTVRSQAIPADIALHDALRALTWEADPRSAQRRFVGPEPAFGVFEVDMQLDHLHVSVLVRVRCVWLDRFPLAVMTDPAGTLFASVHAALYL